jgi:Zn-finger nucleic acid-binding protein
MDPRLQSPVSLICPKCQGAMRAYERSGITVDQCTECRGIYLDRGELERLLDAEAAAPTPASAGFAERDDLRNGPRGSRRRDDDAPDGDDAHDRDDDGPGTGDRRLPRDDQRINGRRESRFGGLLDLFGGGD